ncbi:GMP synthase (glutamine-hydrolyzing), partial [candidate division KSB1 bacterium]
MASTSTTSLAQQKESSLHREKILVLDFGSQYTQLIARRIRELGVYSEIKPYNFPFSEISSDPPQGIILSGGPASVYAQDAPLPDKRLFELGIPILGICYGLQVIAHLSGGKVAGATRREYGAATLQILDSSDLFKEIPSPTRVWMSHGDHLSQLPPGFKVIATTANLPIAAIRHVKKRIYGIQF